MKCPLMAMGGFASGKVHAWGDFTCIKEECAWWVERVGTDGVGYKACALVALVDLLHGIVKKIPEATSDDNR